jgi:hypothetical protein
VAVINDQFARTYFKGQNPIGQRIRVGAVMGPGFEDRIREIVGVVGDTKHAGLDAPAPAILYLPQAQIPDRETQMEAALLGLSWVVRTRSGQADVAAAAQRIFMDNARTPLLSVESMQDVISASVAQQRFTMMLLGCFGLMSLLMGGAGLYGVMSYSVARRTKEIGLRMAIGAHRGDILRMILREAVLLVALGLVIRHATAAQPALRHRTARSIHARCNLRCAAAHRPLRGMVAGQPRRIHRAHAGPAYGIENLPEDVILRDLK